MTMTKMILKIRKANVHDLKKNNEAHNLKNCFYLNKQRIKPKYK